MAKMRLDLSDDIYYRLKILAAIHDSGGAKPEAEKAVEYWVEIHKDNANPRQKQKPIVIDEDIISDEKAARRGGKVQK